MSGRKGKRHLEDESQASKQYTSYYFSELTHGIPTLCLAQVLKGFVFFLEEELFSLF